MSVEMQTRLQSTLGVTLPATTAFEFPSIAELCRHLLEDVLGLACEDAPSAPAHDDSQFESMSDDHLFDLLAEELGGGEVR